MMKFFYSALVLFFCWSHTHALQEKQSGRAPQTAQVRRQDGLDHWDSDTLAYYLDNYPGYDAAVMFYASWDTNSQQLAPYWNQIAHGMDAGSSQSKIIMVSLQPCTHSLSFLMLQNTRIKFLQPKLVIVVS